MLISLVPSTAALVLCLPALLQCRQHVHDVVRELTINAFFALDFVGLFMAFLCRSPDGRRHAVVALSTERDHASC